MKHARQHAGVAEPDRDPHQHARFTAAEEIGASNGGAPADGEKTSPPSANCRSDQANHACAYPRRKREEIDHDMARRFAWQ